VPALPHSPRGLVRSLLGRVRLVRLDDRGATAVEYGLIIALIAAVVAGAVALLGTTVLNAFTSGVSGF